MRNCIFTITVVFLLVTFSISFAETATRIPLTVNVVEGCDVSEEEIRAVVAEASEIMKPFMISYEVKKINRHVTGAGTDGKIAGSEEHGVVTGAMNEIKNADGSYNGMKVFYGDELRQPNYYGMAYHADNGGHWYSVPVVFMKKRPGTTTADYKEKGNDLAHELAHSLTLVGAKPVSGANDPNSDRWGHMTNPLDSDNLMYKNNGGTPPYRVERGGKLAPEQIKEIKENAKRFGKNYVVTPSDEYYKAMHPQEIIIYNHQPRVLWVDDPNETYTMDLYNDLAFGYFYAESTSVGLMDIVINLAGAFPDAYPLNILVNIYLDTDNDLMTGSAEGYDKIVTVDLMDVYPTVHTVARLLDYNGILIDHIPVAIFEQTNAICDVSNPDLMEESTIEPFTDTLFVQLPSEWLEITADEIPVKITYQNNTTSSWDEVSFTFNTQTVNEPEMELLINSITPGQPIEISGTGYTPLEPVEIYLDNDLLTTVGADASGNFTEALPYPSGYDFGRYFLSARDTTRSISDFSILTLFHLPGDVDLNHEVNLQDLVYIAQSWLVIE
jgi:hypothetical protein